MKSWKIAKLQIENFKPFEHRVFELNNASMTTLDGPNGFGKTSVFDAIELLLTGKIQRIIDTSDAIAPPGRAKKSFTENLLWNTKKNGPIVIKAHITNQSEDTDIVLARVAKTDHLKDPKNNCPENFEAFKLYKLESFDSEIYEQEFSSDQLTEILGDNFSKNFELLNYLEQGQNKYLYSKNVSERKKGIEHLINTEILSTQIKHYQDLELKITKSHTGAEKERSRKALEQEIKALETSLSTSETPPEYKKISTTPTTPKWDAESPISTENPKDLESTLREVSTISSIHKNPDEIKKRIHNKKIDDFLRDRALDILLTTRIGAHLEKHQTLKGKNQALLKLNQDLAILKYTAQNITKELLDKINTDFSNKATLQELINQRDTTLSLTSEKNQNLLLLSKAHDELLTCHEKAKHDNDSSCPFCGQNWPTYELLLEAASDKTNAIKKEIDGTTEKLAKILGDMAAQLNITKSTLTTLQEEAGKNFDKTLLEDLERNSSKFEIIRKIIERLKASNIALPEDYTNSPEICLARSEVIKSKITQLKHIESDSIPDNWKITLDTAFEKPEHIDDIKAEDINAKIDYIKYCYSKICNDAHTKKKAELEQLTKTMAAAQKVKDKLVSTRKILEDIRRDFTKKTIADIELLFHIYSGRLIQNYQRGLGLFISTENGDTLKFNTAEKSEHDAILSMSSGQIAALGIAFFLSLNKVYAKNPFILIDDPVQSMDEINIASLSDLLRVELSDRQILLSNHEEEISAFLRYKFKRAGLSQTSIDMQPRQS